MASHVSPQQGFGCPQPPALAYTKHILEPCLIHPSAQNTLPTFSPKQTLLASFYVFQQVPSPPGVGWGAVLGAPFSNFPRTLCLSLQLAETLITLQNGQLRPVRHWGEWGGVGGGTCLALPSIPRLGPLPGFLVTAQEVTQVFPIEADLGWWPRSGVLCGTRESRAGGPERDLTGAVVLPTSRKSPGA